jgi:hypothetical protein
MALLALLLLIGLSIAIWFSREILLQAAADYWIISDEVRAADAVAVLGGHVKSRAEAAGEYYRAGLVQKVLISNVQSLISSSDPEMSRLKLAIRLSVPESAIEMFGTHGLPNTYAEAVALRDWVLRTCSLRLIVPTEIFSARRVRWILKRELVGTGALVQVPALNADKYARIKWWESDEAIRSFRSEVIKYIYYRLRY